LCELVFLSPFVTCVQGDAGQSGTYTLHRLIPETHVQTSVNFCVCVTYGDGMGGVTLCISALVDDVIDVILFRIGHDAGDTLVV